MSEALFSPHHDFYIDYVSRSVGYDMKTFHLHKKYEVYYQVDGPRRYYIDESSYLVNAGSIVLIGPDSVHKATSVENMPHTRFVLNFNPEYLQVLQDGFAAVNLLKCFSSGEPVLPLSPKRQSVVHGLLKRLWEHYEEDSAVSVALRKLCLAELLILLAEYAEDIGERSTGKISNPVIDQIQSYISAHYTEHLTLSQIAAQFYISPHYLSRLFKKTTNLSITEYINSVRLSAAKNMLESSNARIARIGEETGFSTTTHFSRIFKLGTGFSPQQYRKLFHNAQRDG